MKVFKDPKVQRSIEIEALLISKEICSWKVKEKARVIYKLFCGEEAVIKIVPLRKKNSIELAGNNLLTLCNRHFTQFVKNAGAFLKI